MNASVVCIHMKLRILIFLHFSPPILFIAINALFFGSVSLFELYGDEACGFIFFPSNHNAISVNKWGEECLRL